MIVNMTPVQAKQFLDTLPDKIAAAIPAMLRATEEPILEGVAQNFLNQSGPDGLWPMRDEIGDGHPLLNDTEELKNAATVGASAVPDASGISFYVNQTGEVGSILGAARHNFGDEPAKYGLPKREFFYVSEEAADQTLQAVADVLLEALL